jgi:hypothetical protein
MNPQPLVASQPATPVSSAAPPSFGKRVFAALGSPFVPPLFITLILLVGNLSYGILESYSKTLLAIVTSIVAEMVLAASSQCLYHGHQRWNPSALACFLALRSLQPALHHLKIRTALSWPSHLEPI